MIYSLTSLSLLSLSCFLYYFLLSVTVKHKIRYQAECLSFWFPYKESEWKFILYILSSSIIDFLLLSIYSANVASYLIKGQKKKKRAIPVAATSIFLSSVPPVILKLDEPENRHLTCIEFTVRGFPHPTLRWFHKDREILQSEYIRTEMAYYQDYLEGCLTFQNPTHYDNGYYTLVATNFLGSVTKTVHGFFLDPPFSEDDGKSAQCNFFIYHEV